MSSEQQPFWRGHRGRVLIASLAGLVTAGIVLGLVIAWASTTVLDAAGLDDEPTTPTSQTPSSPTTPDASTTPPETSESTEPTDTGTPGLEEPTLTASPTSVASYESITLSGRIPGLASGAPLQIERKQGGTWTLFPVGLTTTELGRFSTFVKTGQIGTNLFRVTDPNSGVSTPTVQVRVG